MQYIEQESFKDFLGQDVKVGDNVIFAYAMSCTSEESPLKHCTILKIRRGCQRWNHTKYKIEVKLDGLRNPSIVNSNLRFIKIKNPYDYQG